MDGPAPDKPGGPPPTPAEEAPAGTQEAAPSTPAEEALAAAVPAAMTASDAAPVASAPSLDDTDVERQRAFADLAGRKGHYAHKAKWSLFLMGVMAGMLVFQSVVIGLVGAEVWTFKGYEWLLPALLVQNLAQIAGLCVIVVKALFKDLE